MPGRSKLRVLGIPLVLTFSAMVAVASPARGAAGGTAPELVLLSPEQGEELGPSDVVIAISIYDADGDVDTSSAKLTLDGVDVTAGSRVTSNLITYAPPVPMGPGRHEFRFEVSDEAGNRSPSLHGSFEVLGGGAAGPRVSFSGSIDVGSEMDDVAGDSAAVALRRQEKWRNTAKLKATVGYGQVKFRANIFLSSDERKTRQPKHRFRFDLIAPHVRITAGDSYPRYSELILMGQRVRGVDSTIRLGFFGLNVTYGQLLRPIEGTAVSEPLPSKPDSVVTRIERPGTFARNLLGIRPTFGSGRRFRLGFTFLKVKDDVNSIEYGLKPKDNLVVGTDLRLAFDRQRIVFSAEAATSLLADDIYGGALSRKDLNEAFDFDVPIDPASYEKIFIINSSLIPLDPRDLSMLAYKLSFRIFRWNNLFRASYGSVGSSYNSLANPSLIRDRKTLRLQDNLQLLRGKLVLSGSYERFTDNLSGDKDATTTSSSFGFTMSFLPAGLPSLTLGYRRHSRGNEIAPEDTTESFVDVYGDTLTVFRTPIDDRNSSVMLGSNYAFNALGAKSNLGFSFMRYKTESDFNRIAESMMNNYVFYLSSRFRFPLRLNFSAGFMRGDFPGMNSDTGYDIYGVRADYGLVPERVDVSASLRVSSARRSEGSYTTASGGIGLLPEVDSRKAFIELGFKYKLSRTDYLSLRAGIGTFRDRAVENSDYDEKTISLRYVQRF